MRRLTSRTTHGCQSPYRLPTARSRMASPRLSGLVLAISSISPDNLSRPPVSTDPRANASKLTFRAEPTDSPASQRERRRAGLRSGVRDAGGPGGASQRLIGRPEASGQIEGDKRMAHQLSRRRLAAALAVIAGLTTALAGGVAGAQATGAAPRIALSRGAD